MKSEMSLLNEMVEEGRITVEEQHKLLREINHDELCRIWKPDAEFDPRRIQAIQQHSLSETGLEDFIRSEFRRFRDEIFDLAITSKSSERSSIANLLADGTITNRDSIIEGSLQEQMLILSRKTGIAGISYLLSLKKHPEFSESPAFTDIVSLKTVEAMRETLRHEPAIATEEQSIKLHPGTVIQFHPSFMNITIVPSTTNELKIKAEKIAFAETAENLVYLYFGGQLSLEISRWPGSS